MRWSNVRFNFWFAHTPPGGHIDGISGDCDLNKQRKVKWFNVPIWSRCPTLPYNVIYFNLNIENIQKVTQRRIRWFVFIPSERYRKGRLSGCHLNVD